MVNSLGNRQKNAKNVELAITCRVINNGVNESLNLVDTVPAHTNDGTGPQNLGYKYPQYL